LLVIAIELHTDGLPLRRALPSGGDRVRPASRSIAAGLERFYG
jgi:hypothetical protein